MVDLRTSSFYLTSLLSIWYLPGCGQTRGLVFMKFCINGLQTKTELVSTVLTSEQHHNIPIVWHRCSMVDPRGCPGCPKKTPTLLRLYLTPSSTWGSRPCRSFTKAQDNRFSHFFTNPDSYDSEHFTISPRWLRC